PTQDLLPRKTPGLGAATLRWRRKDAQISSHALDEDLRTASAFTRAGLSLLLPISVNVSITQVLVPALAAILARTSSPVDAIGGYAVALGVVQLLKLPELRVQQLTLVFL